ncbi:MAG: hypothetical protein RR517_19350 [Pseudomonas sp.]
MSMISTKQLKPAQRAFAEWEAAGKHLAHLRGRRPHDSIAIERAQAAINAAEHHYNISSRQLALKVNELISFAERNHTEVKHDNQ